MAPTLVASHSITSTNRTHIFISFNGTAESVGGHKPSELVAAGPADDTTLGRCGDPSKLVATTRPVSDSITVFVAPIGLITDPVAKGGSSSSIDNEMHISTSDQTTIVATDAIKPVCKSPATQGNNAINNTDDTTDANTATVFAQILQRLGFTTKLMDAPENNDDSESRCGIAYFV
jgi:hypothetical protein